MRGTVLNFKRRRSDFSGPEDDSEEENYASLCDKPNHASEIQNSLCAESKSNDTSDIQNALCAESSSNDSSKSMLMSSLELRSLLSSEQAESQTMNIVSTSVQRPVFNWNNESMWKAMSQHPLFSKYMELQAQLNSMFEEIRLDCKKAACEKAFASLLKETSDTTLTYLPVVVQAKTPVETISKKRGKPALKKRGRPRKDATTPKKSLNLYDNPPSPDSSNGTTSANKHVRKSREQLFLARKPSWTCKECEKQFSGPGWLERHQSICSIARLSRMNPEIAKGIQHQSQTFGIESADIDLPSQKVNMSEQVPSESSAESSNALHPKMENHYHLDDDDNPPNEGLSLTQDTNTHTCLKCKQQFPDHDHLQKHIEDPSVCKNYTSLNGDDLKTVHYSPTPDKVSSCKYCGKSFRKHKFLKRHQSLCHVSPKKKIWQCIHCLKGFLRQVQFEQHQAQCFFIGKAVTREVQRCENCSMLFATQKKLLKHQAVCCPDSNNHMMQLLKCLKCSVVFPSYKKQLKHRAMCCPDSDTEAMVCRHCLKVFIMRDRMEAHKKKCSKVVVRQNL